MNTRDRILNTALALFNEQGTGAVSTNHIAASLEISPGNLYYHFRNKQDIICALFERLFASWDESFNLPADRAPDLADLDQMIARTYALIWDYRFVYRELASLLRDDPVLHGRYLELRRRGYHGFAELIEGFAAAGVLVRPDPSKELGAMTELAWIVSEQWPVTLELQGRPFDAAGIQDGIALMRHLFRPYLPPGSDEARS